MQITDMEMNWLIAFGLIWVVEFALFGMQRATLLISRNAGVKWRGSGELLLPSWYPITWLVIIGKWGLLVAIAIFWDWRFALGLAIGDFIVSSVVPIPYGAYKKIFQRRVNQLMLQDHIFASQLQKMLDSSPF